MNKTLLSTAIKARKIGQDTYHRFDAALITVIKLAFHVFEY